MLGTSLAVQWLRLCASTAGGVGSIPGRGTEILRALQRGKKKKKGKYMGMLKADKGYFNKVCADSSWAQSTPSPPAWSLVTRMFFASGGSGGGEGVGMFHRGGILSSFTGHLSSPAFRKKRGGWRSLLVSAVFQVPYLKIVNMPNQHVLGWCVLNPLNVKTPVLFCSGLGSTACCQREKSACPRTPARRPGPLGERPIIAGGRR